MRQNDSLMTVMAWQQTSRFVVLGLLFLSGCQFLAAALVYRTVGRSETDTLIFAGCLMMAGFAFALGLAFRKSGAPTWKHKLAVAVVALPAAISLLLR
ncbi:MAG: hypothetical protein EOP62_10245 [Sphingomonadales bacterium]|nr:MAG: hypothetical protein EOP62_10245 [Sphingomonadales bacterium]